jgi:putative DNA primase/helicase
MGAVLEQILPFALGAGANGKSTLLEASMHALGRGGSGYAIAASSELLMQRQFTDHPTELAQLHGARLVVCSELSEGARFSEGRVKQLTGRDSIPARYMRGNWFTFEPSHTIWVPGNHRPEVRTGGFAFWRRVRLIPFDRTVPEDRQDRRLGERLAEEAPAVLAWIVRGAVDYHRGGLAEPPAVRAATAAYARNEDTVARFIAECCHLADGQPLVRVATTRLRRAYEQWCQQTGDAPVWNGRVSAPAGALAACGTTSVSVCCSPRTTMRTVTTAGGPPDLDRSGVSIAVRPTKFVRPSWPVGPALCGDQVTGDRCRRVTGFASRAIPRSSVTVNPPPT